MITRSPAGASNPWIAYLAPKPSARVRLYCFPYAGGGASTFRRWGAELPVDLEVRPVQPPGREGRIGEPAYRMVEPLVEALAAALPDDPGEGLPFALFGHSMGALIGYELARLLRRQARPEPSRLLISAHRAPQQPPREDPIHDLPEPEFRQRLRELNGTPEAVLEHPELMELLGPLLRADFALNETYVQAPDEPLDCPITAFGGDADPDVTVDDLRLWQECTRGPFQLHLYRGDHFFLHHDAGLALRRQIASDLAS
jgi:medium-chain acyl-[acyl-carrier-protein] hydrolase